MGPRDRPRCWNCSAVLDDGNYCTKACGYRTRCDNCAAALQSGDSAYCPECAPKSYRLLVMLRYALACMVAFTLVSGCCRMSPSDTPDGGADLARVDSGSCSDAKPFSLPPGAACCADDQCNSTLGCQHGVCADWEHPDLGATADLAQKSDLGCSTDNWWCQDLATSPAARGAFYCVNGLCTQEVPDGFTGVPDSRCLVAQGICQ
jgi:hypothetical protein